MSPVLRARLLALLVAALTIATGVAVRKFLPWGFWSKYSGVALWALAVYALVVFVRPRASVPAVAAAALAISWGIEFAQLTFVPGWLSAKHPLLRMIFGEHFSVFDLPAYAVGVVLGAALFARISPRPSATRAQAAAGPA